jgi:phosphoglycolate phosphatase-like HAD superfamily hydrolase
MAEQKKIAVIWDWDYTIVNSVKANYEITMNVLSKIAGKEPSQFPFFKDYKTYLTALWSYPSWRDLFSHELGFSDKQMDQIATTWATQSLDIKAKPRLYQGIRETITNLGSQGIYQAIQSDNTRENIVKTLQKKNLLRNFSQIIGHDTIKNANLKPKPSADGLISILDGQEYPEVVYCIGDVMDDISAANNLKAYLQQKNHMPQVKTIWAVYGLTQEESTCSKTGSPQIT